MPPVFVVRRADGGLINRVAEADISGLRKEGYTPVEPFQVTAADGKTAIYGNLFRPSTFDASKKYPVIDSIYTLPSVIRTGKSFSGALFNYFEAQSLAELGFIVVTIDGRGTAYRSKAFLDYAYGHLDKVSDLDDHIAANRELARRYPYMDLDRVGADGVSAGGYGAARAILAYPDFYKVAVAAEGNQDQRAGPAALEETMLGPLDANTYTAASNLPLAAHLKGKLLLMHGDLDESASPSLTMKLVDALVKADRDFDLVIVPNEGHSMFAASPYFIRKKWDYFVRNLRETP
jgi:dipeptidyl aminopeptidase/acylaminoacyl peptidase